MLVLSRKIDQQIMIGDNITLTVVRVEGNRVRIGISAPRDIRILRGELASEAAATEAVEFELSEREFAFAHQNASDRIHSANRPASAASETHLFSGTVSVDGSNVALRSDTPSGTPKPAPLASFVSAS